VDIRRTLLDALQIGTGSAQEVLSFTNSWQTLPQRYHEFNTSAATGRIPTGIGPLDNTLGGGLGAYEVGMISGTPGVGKSRMLVHLAAVAKVNQKNVLIVSNELQKLDYELMLACRFTGLAPELIQDSRYRDKYDQLMSATMNIPGFMEIIYYPPFRMTIDMLRGLITRVQHNRGQKVDLVILDMFDRVGGINERDIWGSQYFVIKDLIGCIAEFDSRLWTTTHIKKASYEKETLGMGDSIGSSGKPQDVDIMLSLNQTEKDEPQKIAYLYTSKVRRTSGQRKVKIYYDKAISYAIDYESFLARHNAAQLAR
jgi:hypothetical protein